MLNPAAAIGNTAWLAASVMEWSRFKRAASSLEQTQRGMLQTYLARNSDTCFGKKHNFRLIRCWEDYAKEVPIRSFEDFRPFVESISSGAQNILTKLPVRSLEPSSGSTGPAKLIPYTATLQTEYRRAVASWVTSTFLAHPNLLAGRAYWSLTPLISQTRPHDCQLPVGFDSDEEYLGGVTRSLIRLTMATPGKLRLVKNMDLYWHLTLLMVLACRDLRLISVWHPSFLGLMVKYMRGNWERLITDLHDGLTVSDPGINISPKTARARELSVAGPEDMTAIWPRLELISCWTDGHAASYLRDIKLNFPDVHVQPKGLVATEAFITIPIDDRRPLAIRSHFFEFLDNSGQIHPSWRLRHGQTYSVVVTTGGGLYRYSLGDRVEVDGFWDQVPCLRFLGKEEGVSDYFGEKLNEQFVSTVLQELFKATYVIPEFALLALDENSNQAAYELYLATSTSIPATLSNSLDDLLRRNPHYDYCRRLNQLGQARIVKVTADSFKDYASRLTGDRVRLGDIKPVALSPLKNWRTYFRLDTGSR